MRCNLRVVYDRKTDRYYPQYENDNGVWEFFVDKYDDGNIWELELEEAVGYAKAHQPYRRFEIKWIGD